eukprot:201663-Ditylum_brightwellii.AAC.1
MTSIARHGFQASGLGCPLQAELISGPKQQKREGFFGTVIASTPHQQYVVWWDIIEHCAE